MESIAGQYLKNPYHNWRHAFDVLQYSYRHISMGQAGMFFHFKDILALYIAEIAHDVAHPGVSNNFLITSGHDLAIWYNDCSPLENMHAHICFQTMRKQGHNVLESLPAEGAAHIRSRVIDAILATDMKEHYQLVEKLKVKTDTIAQGEGTHEQEDCR